MALFLIKQIPDDYAEQTGLAKYNRSRMPGCKDSFQAYLDEHSNTYTTGLSSEYVESISQTSPTDYGKSSPFWSDFRVVLDADKPKVFNTEKLVDEISLKMLIANKYVAPDKDSINDPQYRDAQYYAYTEESEIKEEVTSRKKRDKALSYLLDMSENKEKMLLYGQYLEGIKYSEKFTEGTLFKMLRSYIEDKEITNAINFLSILQKPIEEVQQKIIIDRALKQRLITRVSIGNKKHAYQYGNVTLGTTLEDLYKNLSSPEYAPDLIAIQKQLETK